MALVGIGHGTIQAPRGCGGRHGQPRSRRPVPVRSGSAGSVECVFRGAVVGLFMDVLSFNFPTRKRIRDHAFVFFRDRTVPDPLSDSSDCRLCTFMPAPACRKDGYAQSWPDERDHPGGCRSTGIPRKDGEDGRGEAGDDRRGGS